MSAAICGTWYRTHDDTKPAGKLTYSQLIEWASNPAKTQKLQTKLIVLSLAPGKTKEVIIPHNEMLAAWGDIDAGNVLLADLVAQVEALGIGAVVYSTASANRMKDTKAGPVLQGNRWRVILRMSSPLDCEAWLLLQAAIARYFGGGSEAVRIQQGLYGPTNPDGGYYEYAVIDGAALDPHNLPPALLTIIEQIHAEERAQEAKARTAPKPKRVKVEGDSIIELANRAYTVRALVEGEGHEPRGRNRYLHRDSTSGTPGIIILEDAGQQFYYSHHSQATDPLADGHRHDAFDLLLHWQYGGDMRHAIKSLADELDPEGQKRRKHEWHEQQDNTAPGNDDNHWAKRRLFVSAADFFDEEITVDYLVKRLLERGTTGQWFGPWGQGKSFLTYDLSVAVATGGEFAGRQCEQGIVLYHAGEGHTGGKRRVKAIGKAMGLTAKDLRLLCISSTTILLDGSNIGAVIREARQLENQLGAKIALIIIDTMARHMTGDENSNKDAGQFVRAVDALREQFPGSVALIVHHSGNSEDSQNRGRGASCVPGAMDFIAKIDKGVLTFTKMKEGEVPSPLEFKLIPVEVGTHEDGEPITSCIVQWGQRADHHQPARPGWRRDDYR